MLLSLCRYWRYSEETRTTDRDFPKPNTRWGRIPDSPKGAFLSDDGGELWPLRKQIKPLIGAREQLLLNWNQNSPIKLYIQCWNQENSINEERWRDRKNEMLDGWNGVCKRQGGKKLHLRLVRLEQVEQRKGWGDTGEGGGRNESSGLRVGLSFLWNIDLWHSSSKCTLTVHSHLHPNCSNVSANLVSSPRLHLHLEFYPEKIACGYIHIQLQNLSACEQHVLLIYCFLCRYEHIYV